ncbi:hypothetical protein [Klenkia sp. PcliD-1-E]|uniref:hypothetical protein n=1 Tax=Klenkia sp. PcliD-1-E TaxID=2954492 RepID=UPI002097C9EB|nr:hypothetical protein [Klenkia sp. PcliD-1-E]MCO7219487.1 hypothetical protein [Klenkia sp. PcliD-1-E]
MSTRYEFIRARGAAVGMWTAADAAEQTGERLASEDVALTLAGDEVTVLVGTHDELRALLARITEAVVVDVERLAVEMRARGEQAPGDLRTLPPGEGGQHLTCPDCGNELDVSLTEIDYRRGARWNHDGTVNIRKSNEVETIDVDLSCPKGHGSFEMPDVADYE